MNDHQVKLTGTMNELTEQTLSKKFDKVVTTIIEFKNDIDSSQEKLDHGKVEKGFEDMCR